MKDDLGDRMKSYYEDRTRISLPRRTNTIIRIDGKAFHTYTRGLPRPFDEELIDDMNATTKFLCENIQNAKFGYVQSDEISIVLTDYDKLTTDAWFDGNIQKMVSIAASLATSKFNQLRGIRFLRNNMHIDFDKMKLAQFDARVFTIPSEEEVINYFIWRQQDATRNSISAVAQALYSHKELHGKTTDQMQELIFQKGQNWNNYPVGQKRGRVVVRKDVDVPTTKEIYDKAKDKTSFVIDRTGDDYSSVLNNSIYKIRRSQWVIVEPPIFTQDKEFIRQAIKRKREA
jgi:tRNA(His) 5'-end guanylyltransferase